MAKPLKLERLYQLKSDVCASIICSAADRRLISNDSLVNSKLTFRVGDHVRLMEVCEARWTATRGWRAMPCDLRIRADFKVARP